MITKTPLKVTVNIDYSKVNLDKIRTLYDLLPYSLKSHHETLNDFIKDTLQEIIFTTSHMIYQGTYTIEEYIKETLAQIEDIKARYYTDFLLALNQ